MVSRYICRHVRALSLDVPSCWSSGHESRHELHCESAEWATHVERRISSQRQHQLTELRRHLCAASGLHACRVQQRLRNRRARHLRYLGRHQPDQHQVHQNELQRQGRRSSEDVFNLAVGGRTSGVMPRVALIPVCQVVPLQ